MLNSYQVAFGTAIGTVIVTVLFFLLRFALHKTWTTSLDTVSGVAMNSLTLLTVLCVWLNLTHLMWLRSQGGEDALKSAIGEKSVLGDMSHVFAGNEPLVFIAMLYAAAMIFVQTMRMLKPMGGGPDQPPPDSTGNTPLQNGPATPAQQPG